MTTLGVLLIIAGWVSAIALFNITQKLVFDPRYALWLKFNWLNFKPFTCGKCLFTWSALLLSTVLFFIPVMRPFWYGFFGVSILLVIAKIIEEKNMKK